MAKGRLTAAQTKTMAALFPTQKRTEALYERIRLMRAPDDEFKLLLKIDAMEASHDLAGQTRPKDWETSQRQVCHIFICSFNIVFFPNFGQAAEAKRKGIPAKNWFKMYTRSTAKMRKIILSNVVQRKCNWPVAMKMMENMKIQNSAGLAICFVLRGQHGKEKEWKKLQAKYPMCLGDIAMNQLMAGSNVDPKKLRIDKSQGVAAAQAKLRTILPPSFIEVIERIEKMETNAEEVERDEKLDSVLCPSPRSDTKRVVVYHETDCTKAILCNKMKKDNYKGFSASVNFGYGQYIGDEQPTTATDIAQFINNCHYLTNAPCYFIMISCRAEDRELVFQTLKDSRAQQQVLFRSKINLLSCDIFIGD